MCIEVIRNQGMEPVLLVLLIFIFYLVNVFGILYWRCTVFVDISVNSNHELGRIMGCWPIRYSCPFNKLIWTIAKWLINNSYAWPQPSKYMWCNSLQFVEISYYIAIRYIGSNDWIMMEKIDPSSYVTSIFWLL